MFIKILEILKSHQSMKVGVSFLKHNEFNVIDFTPTEISLLGEYIQLIRKDNI